MTPTELLKARHHMNLGGTPLGSLPTDQTHVNLNTVVFNDKELQVEIVDGEPYVALKPIVEDLGLDWSAQYRRVKRDLVLQKAIAMVAMANSQHGQEMLLIKLKMLPGWFFTIDNSSVSEGVRDRLIKYQEEVYDVIYEYFFSGYALNHRVLRDSPHDEEYNYQKMKMMSDLRRIAFSVLNSACLLINDYSVRADFLAKTMGILSKIYPSHDDRRDRSSNDDKIALIQHVLATGFALDGIAIEALCRIPRAKGVGLLKKINANVMAVRKCGATTYSLVR